MIAQAATYGVQAQAKAKAKAKEGLTSLLLTTGVINLHNGPRWIHGNTRPASSGELQQLNNSQSNYKQRVCKNNSKRNGIERTTPCRITSSWIVGLLLNVVMMIEVAFLDKMLKTVHGYEVEVYLSMTGAAGWIGSTDILVRWATMHLAPQAQELSQLQGARHFCPIKMYEKLTNCPNFT